jgi:hypothetical protein
MNTKALLIAALAVGGFVATGCDREDTTGAGNTPQRATDMPAEQRTAAARDAQNTADQARTAAGHGDDNTGPVTDTINKIDNAVGAGADAPGHAGEGVDQQRMDQVNREPLKPENTNQGRDGQQNQQQQPAGGEHANH